MFRVADDDGDVSELVVVGRPVPVDFLRRNRDDVALLDDELLVFGRDDASAAGDVEELSNRVRVEIRPLARCEDDLAYRDGLVVEIF